MLKIPTIWYRRISVCKLIMVTFIVGYTYIPFYRVYIYCSCQKCRIYAGPCTMLSGIEADTIGAGLVEWILRFKLKILYNIWEKKQAKNVKKNILRKCLTDAIQLLFARRLKQLNASILYIIYTLYKIILKWPSSKFHIKEIVFLFLVYLVYLVPIDRFAWANLANGFVGDKGENLFKSPYGP